MKKIAIIALALLINSELYAFAGVKRRIERILKEQEEKAMAQHNAAMALHKANQAQTDQKALEAMQNTLREIQNRTESEATQAALLEAQETLATAQAMLAAAQEPQSTVQEQGPYTPEMVDETSRLFRENPNYPFYGRQEPQGAAQEQYPHLEDDPTHAAYEDNLRNQEEYLRTLGEEEERKRFLASEPLSSKEREEWWMNKQINALNNFNANLETGGNDNDSENDFETGGNDFEDDFETGGNE